MTTTPRSRHERKMTQAAIEKATAYAKRIKNAVKREYAYAVIFSFGSYEIPRPYNLSHMAAQAVRMNIAQIVKDNPQ